MRLGLSYNHLVNAILVFFLFVHISTTLILIVSPKFAEQFSNFPAKYYRSYAAIGPFFTDKSLNSSYDLIYAVKSKYWQPWINPQRDNYNLFIKNFAYSKLKQAEFEKHLAWKIYSEFPENKTLDFAFQHLSQQIANIEKFDSIRICVLWRHIDDGNLKTDTLVTYVRCKL